MKIIDRGWAKPDAPIYQTGLTVGGQRVTQSTKAPTTAAGGDAQGNSDASSPQPTAPKAAGKNSKPKRKG